MTKRKAKPKAMVYGWKPDAETLLILLLVGLFWVLCLLVEITK